jgi:hypothetical protein
VFQKSPFYVCVYQNNHIFFFKTQLTLSVKRSVGLVLQIKDNRMVLRFKGLCTDDADVLEVFRNETTGPVSILKKGCDI